MAHHLEAIAAREHGADRTQLIRMCAALQDSLDQATGDPSGDGDRGPVDDQVAGAIDRSLTSLRTDLDGHRVDREDARVRLRRLVALAGAVRGGDHAQSPASDRTRPIVDADPWDYRRDRHREGIGGSVSGSSASSAATRRLPEGSSGPGGRSSRVAAWRR